MTKVFIKDGGMTIELEGNDPRVEQIRAILFKQPAEMKPTCVLWQACTDEHREVLLTIARHGEISQIELEAALDLNGVALRGRNGGLARIAKRVGVLYPIESAGTRRSNRRFSLVPEAAREILRISEPTQNEHKLRRNR